MSTCAALTLAVMVPPSTIGASVSTLHQRAHRQEVSLHRWVGTQTFFRRHSRLARTPIGRREVRKARVWVRVLRHELAETRASLRTSNRGFMSVPQIICVVFGPYCGQALAVARCESGLSVNARNGQYENLFQMGYNERRRYGWHTAGSSPWLAARAAYRYFMASGASWGPWQCKP